MRYRRFGRLHFPVSELTAGTWGYDQRIWKDADAAETEAALLLALESGVNMIDVAAAYGEAEQWIGALLRRWNVTGIHIATKVTPLLPIALPSPQIRVDQAFPGWHIRRSTENSLRALGVEQLALQQLHAWSPAWIDEGDWLSTMEALQREGKIAGFGVSLFDHDADAALPLVERGLVDAVQVMYNLFDQGAARALLRHCERHDVAVIVRSPLYAGALTAGILDAEPFRPGDWRRHYFYPEHLAETRSRMAAVARDAGGGPEATAELALRFCLSDRAVSTVAVGMRRRWHVYANLKAMGLGPLDPHTRARLVRHAWLC
jgi:aryl-alcohol dehydrogenase-like predicted oxidoreductase